MPELFKKILKLRAEGKFDAALHALDRAEKLKPKERDENTILFLRGLIHFETGKYQPAIDCLTMVEGALGSLPENLQMIGAAYKHLGQYNLAIEFFSKAISQACDHGISLKDSVKFPFEGAEIFGSRAECYEALGDYAKALADLNDMINLGRPGFFQRGELHLKLGNYQAALEDFNKVILIEANNKNCFGLHNLEYLFERFEDDILVYQDYESKLVNIGKLLRLNPMVQAAYEKRREAYKKMKESKQ